MLPFLGLFGWLDDGPKKTETTEHLYNLVETNAGAVLKLVVGIGIPVLLFLILFAIFFSNLEGDNPVARANWKKYIILLIIIVSLIDAVGFLIGFFYTLGGKV